MPQPIPRRPSSSPASSPELQGSARSPIEQYWDSSGDQREARLNLLKAVQTRFRPLLDELKGVWALHEAASLEIHHRSGLLIATKMNELQGDPKQGQALQAVIASELGRNRSDISRELAFVARWPEFDRFKAEQPTITTWSALKEKLAELSRSEKPTRNGTVKPKKSTEKQRAALIEKYQQFREEIGEIKDDFSVKQLAAVETITEGILSEVDELAAPLKKASKLHNA